jgi:hypothetical protein
MLHYVLHDYLVRRVFLVCLPVTCCGKILSTDNSLTKVEYQMVVCL